MVKVHLMLQSITVATKVASYCKNEWTVMSAIVDAVAANGITALSGKVISKFYKKLALPLRMRRNLAHGDVREKADSIKDALERAIGNTSGLTPATNQSLIDLSSSGLLDHILSVLPSDLSIDESRELIKYIHLARGSESEQESAKFADDLIVCLKTVSAELEETLSELFPMPAVRRHQQTIADGARRSSAVISNIVSSLKDSKGEWLDGKEYSPYLLARQIEIQVDPLHKYVKTLLNSLSSVDVHGASGDVVRIDLDEIFVDVPVCHIPRPRNFVKYLDLRKELPRHEVSRRWKETLELTTKTVLLGDPGGGKSTLSKKLCCEVAKSYINGEGTLPIFVQLRTYIASALEDDHLTLGRYIIDQISSAVLDPSEASIDASILYHLRIGSAFIVADGLDEVLTAANRARVTQEINKFVKEFPFVNILVTSRYVGYETQPLSTFDHFGVDDLHLLGRRRIYTNVSRSVLKKTRDEVSNSVDTFMLDASRKAEELIKSPLLLTLIVIIYSKKSEIPDNRASLYGHCADLLFDRWDGYRKIIPDLPERYRLFDLFKHLAALLYQKEEYGGRINKKDLFEEARNFFREDYIDNREGKSAEAATQMVDHLTGRAWILHEVGEDVFEFTHRTFMEFFFARHLETVFESTDELISECAGQVLNDSRTVPSHLALQIRTKDKRIASTKVCDQLANILVDGEVTSDFINFCLEALGYLLPDARSMLRFVDALAPLTLKLGDVSAQIKLLCNDSPMRMTILEGALTTLQSVSDVDQVRTLAPALYRMRRSGGQHIERSEGGAIDVISMIVDRTYPKQSTSPFLCKLAFDLDAKTNWTAIEKFGFRVWTNSRSMGISRFAMDSRKMLAASSINLRSGEDEKGKYFRLATIIRKKYNELKGQKLFDYYYSGNVFVHDSVDEFMEVHLDPSGWREDKEALELFAFCLALFLETNLEGMKEHDLKRFKAAFVNLVDELESIESDKAEWYAQWIKGENALIVRQRYMTRKMRRFWEE